MRIVIRVNGEARELEVDPGATLLSVLRERLRLTGSKEACGRGECGACTVLVDGRPVLSCMTLAPLVRGEVTTVEGLAESARDLREAFADRGAFQCGYCTPGQIVRAAALLDSGVDLDEPTVRDQMSGNVCRCTGYTQIVDAVLETGRRRASGRGAAAPRAPERTPV